MEHAHYVIVVEIATIYLIYLFHSLCLLTIRRNTSWWQREFYTTYCSKFNNICANIIACLRKYSDFSKYHSENTFSFVFKFWKKQLLCVLISIIKYGSRVNLPNKPNGKHYLKLKIDTGASGNTLPVRTRMQVYPQQLPQLQHNNTKLTAYNGEQIKCIGKFTIVVHHNSIIRSVLLYVVDVTGPAVIGLPTCEQMDIVTINVDHISSSVPTISNLDDLT